MQSLIHAFFNDTRTQVILLAAALDLLLGVIVAFWKTKNFRLSFVADVFRNDIIPKVLGFLVIYAGYLYAKNVDVVIPGLDLEVLMNGAFGVITLALVGSILGSVKQLGLTGLPDTVAGPDPATPTPPSNPS